MQWKALPDIALQTKKGNVQSVRIDREAGGRSGAERPPAECSEYTTFRSSLYRMGHPIGKSHLANDQAPQAAITFPLRARSDLHENRVVPRNAIPGYAAGSKSSGSLLEPRLSSDCIHQVRTIKGAMASSKTA